MRGSAFEVRRVVWGVRRWGDGGGRNGWDLDLFYGENQQRSLILASNMSLQPASKVTSHLDAIND